MTAVGLIPLVQVSVEALDESWVGERLLVTHSASRACSRTWGKPLPKGHRHMRCTHFGGLSELSRPAALALVLFLGGEQVLVTADDIIVAAPTPTSLEIEPDVAGSPYDC